jgi:hypothetical protein
MPKYRLLPCPLVHSLSKACGMQQKQYKEVKSVYIKKKKKSDKKLIMHLKNLKKPKTSGKKNNKDQSRNK